MARDKNGLGHASTGQENIGVKCVPRIIPALRNFGRIPLRKRAGVEPFQIVRPEPFFGEGGHYEYVTKFKNPATVLGNPLLSNIIHEMALRDYSVEKLFVSNGRQ
jgi:hypothetical protein